MADPEETSPGIDGFITNPLSEDTDRDGLRDDIDLCPNVFGPDNSANLCIPIDPATLVGELEITEVRPLTGKVGDLVQIFGNNFVARPLTAVQFGAAGTLVEINTASITPNLISVRVPRGAQDDRITLFNAGRSTTSTPSFTFLEPPAPESFRPAAARIGETVVVFGRYFENLQSVAIGDRQAVTESCDPTIVPPAGRSAICFRVPPMATTAPISVTTDNGTTATRSSFPVLQGPRIDRIAPPRAAPNSIIQLIGEGFGGFTSLEVRFTGGASVSSERVTEQAVFVRVPTNAVTGLVTVEHPAGDAVSPDPLTVDNLVPAIVQMSPSLAMAGETIVFTGVNLAAATEVEFPGGRVAVLNPSGTSIEAIVPSNVDPGPVYVHFPNSVTATSAVDLAVLERFEQPTTQQFARGALSNATQTEVSFFDTNGDIDIYAADTLALVGSRMIVPGAVESLGTNFVWSSEAGDRLVIEGMRNEGRANVPTIFSVDPIAFRSDAECQTVASVNDVAFFGDRAFYISNYGGNLGAQLTEFNLTTGECGRFSDATGGIAAYAMYYEGRGRLHVYVPSFSSSAGQATVDIDPSSPTYGAYLDAPTGVAPVNAVGGWAWWGRQSNDVYIASQRLFRAVRLSSDRAVTLVQSLSAAPPLISLDQRWVAIGLGDSNDIVFDNVRGIVARRGLPFGDTSRGVALAGPQGTRFVIYRNASFNPISLIRYDIRD